MSNEEANKVFEELHEVRPEMLNDKAKRLFEAIMKIADSRDKAESDLYEANNRINDLLDLVKQKDKIIDLMAKEIDDLGECPYEIYEKDFDCKHCENNNSKECWKKYFEERCNKC